MQEPALVLARLDQILLAREPIDDSDPDPGLVDPVAQLRGEVPLNLLAREPSHSLEERSDMDLGAAVGDEGPLGRHRVQKLSNPMPNSPWIPVTPLSLRRRLTESQICVAT